MVGKFLSRRPVKLRVIWQLACFFSPPRWPDCLGPVLTALLLIVGKCTIRSHSGYPVTTNQESVSFPAVGPRSQIQRGQIGLEMETAHWPAACGFLNCCRPTPNPSPRTQVLTSAHWGQGTMCWYAISAHHAYGHSTTVAGHKFPPWGVRSRGSRPKRKPHRHAGFEQTADTVLSTSLNSELEVMHSRWWEEDA